MNRKALQPLIDWTQDSKRKPLVIRGARQVGKTWLVRYLAQKCFTHLLEINFDQTPQKADLITTDIEQSLLYLNLDTGIPIEDGKTLIFFDEIQNTPHLLHCLRYFYETRPQLHVIVAGSLLDFTLNDHAFSMPVGRLSYFHLGPMSFEEFLEAHQQNALLQLIKTYTLKPPPDSLHQKLLSWIKRYYLVGGMPSVVACSVEHDSWQPLQLEQEDLISTYRDDFTKYQGRVDLSLLRHLFNRLPNQIGKKIKYSHFQADTPSKKIALHLQHLMYARLTHPIYHSSANGLPLGAEVDEKKFKLLFLDLGLLSTQCGLSLNSSMSLEAFTWVNQGQLAEQFIGQHLLYRKGPRFQPLLYYWLRENKRLKCFAIHSGVCGCHLLARFLRLIC